MFKRIKELKDECPICEKKRNLVYGKRTDVVKVRGEIIPVKVNVYHCADGDHYFYDLKDEEDKYQTAYREYRTRKGLLQPETIKQLREKYGLSQRAFARFLGWGTITIQRYETGALQDTVHNDLLVLLEDTYSFTKYFETKRNSLPTRIIGKIEERLRKISESEKQLDIEFFFRHARMEMHKVSLRTEVLGGKSANKGSFKSLLDIFARQETGQQLRSPVEIMEKTGLALWHAKRTNRKTDGNFSINKEGELALAA